VFPAQSRRGATGRRVRRDLQPGDPVRALPAETGTRLVHAAGRVALVYLARAPRWRSGANRCAASCARPRPASRPHTDSLESLSGDVADAVLLFPQSNFLP